MYHTKMVSLPATCGSVEVIDCDMVTDYEVLLEFDDERVPLDFDGRSGDPEAYSAHDDHCDSDFSRSLGCVVDMVARAVGGTREKRVRRSNAWLPVDCFCKHSIHAQFEVDSTS